MEILIKYICPIHGKPMLSFCCSRSCLQPMPICQFCKGEHRSHPDKLVAYDNIVPSILSGLNQQNVRDTEVMKENNVLNVELTKFRNVFVDREKQLITSLVQMFEEEKNQILRKVYQQKEKKKSSIVTYFDKMSQNGLLYYRMLFSSQKGVQSLYDGYRQYCQISGMNSHLNPNILPKLEDDEEQYLDQDIKKSMTGTLTQGIMNYMKLKISKKDAMKVSCALAASSMRPQPSAQIIGLPPLSPERRAKARKTEVNIV